MFYLKVSVKWSDAYLFKIGLVDYVDASKSLESFTNFMQSQRFKIEYDHRNGLKN